MRRPLTKLQKRPVGLLEQKSVQFALKLLIWDVLIPHIKG